jgi:hypothetical protein
MFLGAIPLNEKIYLSNKTLVNAEDLKIGDKILSLKILDEDIKDSTDFYEKYIKEEKRVDKFELSEATVYSVYLDKESRGKFVKTGNQFIHHGQYIAVGEFWTDKNIPIFGFYKSWTIPHLSNLDNLKILKLKENFTTYNLEELKIFDYQDFDSTEELLEGNSFSINIVGGHFYFTENFILFAGGDSSW